MDWTCQRWQKLKAQCFCLWPVVKLGSLRKRQKWAHLHWNDSTLVLIHQRKLASHHRAVSSPGKILTYALSPKSTSAPESLSCEVKPKHCGLSLQAGLWPTAFSFLLWVSGWVARFCLSYWTWWSWRSFEPEQFCDWTSWNWGKAVECVWPSWWAAWSCWRWRACLLLLLVSILSCLPSDTSLLVTSCHWQILLLIYTNPITQQEQAVN